jgi:hypothetical protein
MNAHHADMRTPVSFNRAVEGRRLLLLFVYIRTVLA